MGRRRHLDQVIFLDRDILAVYRDHPEQYLIAEDRVGGELRTRTDLDSDLQTKTPYLRVRYGYCRVKSGEPAIVALASDVASLPAKERRRWHAFLLKSDELDHEDPGLQAWLDYAFHGAWTASDHPMRTIRIELARIRAITEEVLGTPLFKFSDTSQLTLPSGENTLAYRTAYLSLNQVLIDGLDRACLIELARIVGVELENPGMTLNSLKAVLPSDKRSDIHGPLKKVRSERDRVHGVPTEGVALPADARPQYGHEIVRVAKALQELRGWLEELLAANADTCLYRQEALRGFPVIEGNASAYPNAFLANFRPRLDGKTIVGHRYGTVKPAAGVPRNEALILELDDGSKVAITISCNIDNLLAQGAPFGGGDLHLNLDLSYAPAPDEDTEAN